MGPTGQMEAVIEAADEAADEGADEVNKMKPNTMKNMKGKMTMKNTEMKNNMRIKEMKLVEQLTKQILEYHPTACSAGRRV